MEPKISRPIVRHSSDQDGQHVFDDIVVEEPLEIRLNNKSISITMRTPGDDFALAAGFLFAEGIISSGNDIENIRFCGFKSSQQVSTNIVRVTLKPSIVVDKLRLDRHFYASSSCGVCGKSSLEALAINAQPIEPSEVRLRAELIHLLPDRLRRTQILFHETGGLHAAALFDSNGYLMDVREDIGRHNAVDKLIGRRIIENAPIQSDEILCISGRASFEILQKAIVARISTIVAVGSPSSLAIDLAERFNLTLIGFASIHRFNVYAGNHRLVG